MEMLILQGTQLFIVSLQFCTTCSSRLLDWRYLRLDVEYTKELNWSTLSKTAFSGVAYLEKADLISFITNLLVISCICSTSIY